MANASEVSTNPDMRDEASKSGARAGQSKDGAGVGTQVKFRGEEWGTKCLLVVGVWAMNGEELGRGSREKEPGLLTPSIF